MRLGNMMQPDDMAIKNLVILAKEANTVDPIDWGQLNITEEQAYIMMATHVLEMERNHLTDGAIIVKLLVENFALNLKLIVNMFKIESISGVLMIPYIVWLFFASYLNLFIVLNN